MGNLLSAEDDLFLNALHFRGHERARNGTTFAEFVDWNEATGKAARHYVDLEVHSDFLRSLTSEEGNVGVGNEKGTLGTVTGAEDLSIVDVSEPIEHTTGVDVEKVLELVDEDSKGVNLTRLFVFILVGTGKFVRRHFFGNLLVGGYRGSGRDVRKMVSEDVKCTILCVGFARTLATNKANVEVRMENVLSPRKVDFATCYSRK